jgi:hypothetical protein
MLADFARAPGVGGGVLGGFVRSLGGVLAGFARAVPISVGFDPLGGTVVGFERAAPMPIGPDDCGMLGPESIFGTAVGPDAVGYASLLCGIALSVSLKPDPC